MMNLELWITGRKKVRTSNRAKKKFEVGSHSASNLKQLSRRAFPARLSPLPAQP
jgi:hypothetical protein